METRNLGPLEVSAVGLGCNNFGRRLDAEATRDVVVAALDAGVTLFDTADVYGDGQSERFLGRALDGARDQVVIATKFGHQMGDDPERSGARPGWIRQAVRDSLQRLGTDHIDLYQLHVPDPDVPIAETLGALDELVDDGLVRAVGCSNVDAGQIDEAAATAQREGTVAFVSVQNRYSVLHREPEDEGVLEACERHGLGMLPYFPLESGLLTGKYTDGFDGVDGRLASMDEERRARFADDARIGTADRLGRFAQQRNRSILDLALSWLLTRPTVTSVIPGATEPEQVRANVAASTWDLTDDDLAEIDRIISGAS